MTTTPARLLRDRRGVSIAETLVAAAMLAGFALAGWTFYRTQVRALGDQSALLNAGEKVRASLELMSRDLRQAGWDPMATALAGMTVARGDRVTIQYDADGGGTTVRSIAYSLDTANGRITRSVDGGTAETLVSGVPANGLALRYFDASGSELPLAGSPPQLSAGNRANVATVLVTVRVRATGMVSQSTLSLASRMTLPNRILGRL